MLVVGTASPGTYSNGGYCARSHVNQLAAQKVDVGFRANGRGYPPGPVAIQPVEVGLQRRYVGRGKIHAVRRAIGQIAARIVIIAVGGRVQFVAVSMRIINPLAAVEVKIPGFNHEVILTERVEGSRNTIGQAIVIHRTDGDCYARLVGNRV